MVSFQPLPLYQSCGGWPTTSTRQKQTYTEANTLGSEAKIPETLEKWNKIFHITG